MTTARDEFWAELDSVANKAIATACSGREARRVELMKTIARGAGIESLQSRVRGLSRNEGYESGLRDAFLAAEMLVKKHFFDGKP